MSTERDKQFEQMAETEVFVEVVVTGLYQLAQRCHELTPGQRGVILAAIAEYTSKFKQLAGAMQESARSSKQ